jgi:hypothetical protein
MVSNKLVQITSSNGDSLHAYLPISPSPRPSIIKLYQNLESNHYDTEVTYKLGKQRFPAFSCGAAICHQVFVITLGAATSHGWCYHTWCCHRFMLRNFTQPASPLMRKSPFSTATRTQGSACALPLKEAPNVLGRDTPNGYFAMKFSFQYELTCNITARSEDDRS